MTLTLPLFRCVRQMLAARLRHCEIARETGLSVWTIDRIHHDLKSRINGNDTSRARKRGAAAAEANDPFMPDLPEDDAPPDYVATNLRRCPGCGGMVYQWPCLTCEIRGLAVPPRSATRS
jgi:hypothetical protein